METIRGIVVLRNELLAKHTTYRIGGPAEYLVFPRSEADLKTIADEIRSSGLPYFILGNGSNVLASDEKFNGWVIKTSQLNSEIIIQKNIIEAGAGAMNSSVLRKAAQVGLSGMEYLAGVPGTIGGAIAMNAGTASGWIEKNIIEVKAYSMRAGSQIFAKDKLRFSYREQHFLSEDSIIVSAKFSMQEDLPEEIQKRIAESIQKRKLAQPIELPSCGSVFRNPAGKQSWQLIDSVGLRGHKIGGARISPKHCNFIVNEGGATREDVLALIQLAKKKVLQQHGIQLQEEVVVFSGKLLK